MIRPLGRPGDLGWVVQAHGETYAAEFGWNGEFEALVARIVADYAGSPRPGPRGRLDRRAATAGGSVACSASPPTPRPPSCGSCWSTRTRAGTAWAPGLTRCCVDFARDAGYRRMRLWTNHPLTAARRIYLAAGFGLVDTDSHHSFGVDLVGQVYELDLTPR